MFPRSSLNWILSLKLRCHCACEFFLFRLVASAYTEWRHHHINVRFLFTWDVGSWNRADYQQDATVQRTRQSLAEILLMLGCSVTRQFVLTTICRRKRISLMYRRKIVLRRTRSIRLNSTVRSAATRLLLRDHKLYDRGVRPFSVHSTDGQWVH